jgi:chromosome segregation protein
MERFSARSNQIREELAEIDAQIDEQRAIRAESEASFEQHDGQLADMQASHEDQQMAFEGMDAKLSGARQQLRDSNAPRRKRCSPNAISPAASTNCAASRWQAIRASASPSRSKTRARTRNDQRADRQHRPAGSAGSARRRKKLSAARIELDALSAQLRQFDEQRLAAERSLQPLRDRITECQLKEQAARLNQEQFTEQLATAEVDEAALAEKLTAT